MAKNNKVDIGGGNNCKNEMVKKLLLMPKNLDGTIDYLSPNTK